jgi:outer membrane lipoprotein-sorting protein
MRLLLCLFALLFFLSSKADAQVVDPKATAILKEMSARYKEYPTLRIVFTLKIENSTGKIQEELSGNLFTKGNMYKLEFNDREIYCDAKTVWSYIKNANEVQITDYDDTEESLNPFKFYTMYEKGFYYALVDEKKLNERTVQIIELTPNDKDKSYFKIRLTIDKADKQLISARVFEKSGTQYLYTIQKLTPNLSLSDSFFVFDVKKYPGIEVVDLK